VLLKQAEYIAKWILAITAIFVAAKFLWKTIVKIYHYVIKGGERYDILVSIANSQEYAKIERQAIMDKISLGYFKSDIEGKTIEVGDVVCKVFGYTEAELLQFKWSAFIIPEDRQRVMDQITEDTKVKRNGYLDYSIVTSTGEIKKVRVTAKYAIDSYFCILEVIK